MEVEDIARILGIDVINITDFLNMSCNLHKGELTPSTTGRNDYENKPDLYEIDSLRQDIKNGKVKNGNVKIEERYLSRGSKLVKLDYENIEDLNVKVVETDLVRITKGYVKHDAEHLAQVLMTTILDKKLLYDKEKIIEYMYLSKKIGDKK